MKHKIALGIVGGVVALIFGVAAWDASTPRPAAAETRDAGNIESVTADCSKAIGLMGDDYGAARTAYEACIGARVELEHADAPRVCREYMQAGGDFARATMSALDEQRASARQEAADAAATYRRQAFSCEMELHKPA